MVINRSSRKSYESTNTYIPGVCNIGQAEIDARKRVGWCGLVITIALWLVLMWFNVSEYWRLTLFVPATISAMGFLQAHMHFCAYFGIAALFNFGDIGKKTDSISHVAFRDRDKRKAWRIIIYALLIGVIVAIVAFLL